MRFLVVHAHPDPDSFSHAIRAAALKGLAAADHEVELIDLYAEDFDPCMSEAEHRDYLTISEDHPDPDVRRSIELVRWAEGLIVIYPTWWSGLPAILKGWFERVFLPGVSFTIDPGTKPLRPALNDMRRLVGITTYGSSRPYRLAVGDPGRRTLLRTIRLAMGRRCRSSWISLDTLDGRSPEERAEFLAHVEAEMAAL